MAQRVRFKVMRSDSSGIAVYGGSHTEYGAAIGEGDITGFSSRPAHAVEYPSSHARISV